MSLERPRFRRDLEARPVSSDGQDYVDVSDHITGKSFRFYDFEYQVALAFDGLALDKVIPWVKLATGLALQVDQLREFARRLDELGFLEQGLDGLVEVSTESPPAERAEPVQTEEPPQPDEVSNDEETSVPPPPVQASTEEETSVPPPPVQASTEEKSSAPPPPVQASTEEETSVPPPPDEASTKEETSGPPPPGEASTEEETSGPPPPDLVVMRPGEVVGETPPPLSRFDAVHASQPSHDSDRKPPGAEPAPDAASVDRPPPTEAEDPTKPSLMDPRPAEAAVAEKMPYAAAEVARPGSQPDDLPAPVQHPARPQSRDFEQAELTAPPGSASSSAFPVLPVTHPTSGAASPPVTPSPWSTPRPLMTPVPSTFGPSLLGDRSSSRRKMRRSLTVFGTLGVLAAAALLAIALPFLLSSRRPQPVGARTVTATPGTVYRYFEGAGIVSQMPGVALKFPTGGKVVRIAAAGVTVAPGDVVAAVEAAVPLLDGLARQRERVAYYRQMVEAMHQVGSSKEEERQLGKLESRNARVAQTLNELSQFAVVASSAGEVEEAFAREGQVVEAGSAAVRLRSPGYSATFDLGRTLAAAAKRLGFCQVEVEGYVLDCSPLLLASDEGHVTVALPAVPATLVGKMAHLVRGRYRNAIVVPTSALQTRGTHTAVLVVSAGGRLEGRPVVVADHDALEAIVVQGLDAGDRIVLEQSARLRPGALVGALP